MALRRSMSFVQKGPLFDRSFDQIALLDLLVGYVEFVEDHNMSVLQADCRGTRFKAIYRPPEQSRRELNTGYQLTSSSEELPGVAMLDGRIEIKDGYLSIIGTWKHVDSILCKEGRDAVGTFEMHSISSRSADEFIGWWTSDTVGAQNDWKWMKNETRDLPTQLVESVWMDRYGMLCAWFFLVQTSIQLASLAEKWDSDLTVQINQVFNLVYALCYTSFLAAFSMSRVAKNWLYTLGVALYTVGYFVFAAIYYGASGASTLYHLGSWLFLIGSLVLMCSTAPQKSGCPYAYSPHRIQSSLWWGSTMFFLGSLFFACDALGLGKPRTNAVSGLTLFVAGRGFFVRGSQTKRCTCLFIGVAMYYRLCCFDGKVTPLDTIGATNAELGVGVDTFGVSNAENGNAPSSTSDLANVARSVDSVAASFSL